MENHPLRYSYLHPGPLQSDLVAIQIRMLDPLQVMKAMKAVGGLLQSLDSDCTAAMMRNMSVIATNNIKLL